MMTTILKPNNNVCRLGFTIFALLACLAGARAATLTDYRLRVTHAADTLERLQASYEDEYSLGRDNFAELTVAQVRDQLPAKETITLGDQTVAVDNSWLHDGLSEYQKVNGNRARSAELLARIVERLRAVIERLDEMQGSATTTKDENKARMAEILRRAEYNKSAAEGSALERLWQRIVNWLARLLRSVFPKSKPLQPGSARALSGIAEVIVIAVGVALTAFLIWKFAPRYFRNRRKKKTKREARIVLGERLEPDQTSADLLEQAELLARSGDLRAAIRKAYIALLCDLGDRKVISLAQHKTNRDYLNAVRNRASLHSAMRRLTNAFELHWYGFVPAGESDWSDFRSGYRTIVTSEK
jgi:hypothetical protein